MIRGYAAGINLADAYTRTGHLDAAANVLAGVTREASDCPLVTTEVLAARTRITTTAPGATALDSLDRELATLALL